MTEPFNQAMGELRHVASLASLSVERSPWRAMTNGGVSDGTIIITNAENEMIALVVDRFPNPKRLRNIVVRPPQETQRHGQLIIEAPAMVRVCEALARSGPGVAMALAGQQIAVPPDLALAIHLAREITGRIG